VQQQEGLGFIVGKAARGGDAKSGRALRGGTAKRQRRFRESLLRWGWQRQSPTALGEPGGEPHLGHAQAEGGITLAG
jgi:hypothetical protein